MTQDAFSQWMRSLDFSHWSTGKHVIDASQFLKLYLRGEAVLLDVRTPEEVRLARFPGALHIPINELPARLDEVPGDRLVVTFCSGGERASIAYVYLCTQGYERVRILKGGYSALMPALMPGQLRALLP